jgi:Raf kinase inhibitor-like YbhB/YbcL family protein
MKIHSLFLALFLAGLLAGGFNAAAHAASVQLTVAGLQDGKTISAPYAYCAPSADGKMADGKNMRPAVSWRDAPDGTKSFAVVMVDPDVPADFTDANQEGKIVASDAARQDFYHWVVVDIPAYQTKISAGSGRGMDKKPLAFGKEAVNDYASFLKDQDPALFKGYDGACPPWNDERLHHYHFRLYALDVESLHLPETFTGKEAAERIKAHSIGMAEVVGTYSLNHNLLK